MFPLTSVGNITGTGIPTFPRKPKGCNQYKISGRLRQRIQITLLPYNDEQDSILNEPPVVEADEGSPLFAYCGQGNILRLFYVRTNRTKRSLSEHNLITDSENHVIYKDGNINTLAMCFDEQSCHS